MVSCVNKSMLPKFSQNVTLQEAFETVAQINKELKITEFDGAFCKRHKLVIDRFSSFFSLNVEIGRENDPSKEKWG